MVKGRDRGFAFLELVIVTALLGIIFYMTAPIFFQFGGIFRELGGKSLSKERNRVFGAIESYMISAGERVEILDIGDEYLSSASPNLERFIARSGEGDGIYMEIGTYCVEGGRIVRKNEVHIFRFYPPTGNQSLRYIPTSTGRMGNSSGILRLGREEILIPNLARGKIKREGKTVVITYFSGKNEERVEFILE